MNEEVYISFDFGIYAAQLTIDDIYISENLRFSFQKSEACTVR